MIKILVGDDHDIIFAGLQQVFRKYKDYKLDYAADGYKVFEKVENNQYDVLILDISMPGSNVIEILKQVKEISEETKVIIYSIYPEDQFAVRLINLGASGYVNKSSGIDDLTNAVMKVVNGDIYISNSLAEQYAKVIRTGKDKVLHETLTSREFQIMIMIAGGYTLDDISEKLFLSKSTINNHRHHILKKLNVKNNTQICLYAVKNRLLLT